MKVLSHKRTGLNHCISLYATLCVTMGAILGTSIVQAVEMPKSSPNDERIRFITYVENQVTAIRVQRGVVTRIVLAPDEKIDIASTGLSSLCDSPSDEWCIHAPPGSRQIFVRPRDGATRNNVEVHTDKRDYSFEFDVLPDPDTKSVTNSKHSSEKKPAAFYRVVFQYPTPPDLIRASVVGGLLNMLDGNKGDKNLGTSAPTSGAGNDLSPREILKTTIPKVHNTKYNMQVLKDGEDAAPTMVYDDGRFTYFEFLGAREIPAIFTYGSDGQAVRVNWHMEPPFVVAQRTARKFTLRLGNAVVGIFNEAFDATGIDTPNSTVSDVVKRDAIIKEKAPQ